MERAASRRAWLRHGALLGAGALATPWWSGSAHAGQRLPATPVRQAARSAQALLQGCGLPASSIGVYARALDAAEPLVALNPETSFALASTAKLVTSMAALDLLGPQFRWRTLAFTRGKLQDGRLDGDLWIVGGGNALLSSQDLLQWMSQWRELGLREIAGNIVLDRFAFHLTDSDHERTPLPAPDRPHHNRPDALTVDEGVLRVSLQSGRSGRMEVQLDPPMAGLAIDQRLVRKGGCSAWAQWEDKTTRGAAQLRVQGQWSAACGRRQLAAFAPLEQTEFSHRAFAGLWAEAGGVLRGRVIEQTPSDRPGRFPLDEDGLTQQPFAVHRSAMLPQLLRDINKTSDNLAARNLMLALSRGFPARAATLPAAQARMREWLMGQGLLPDDVQVENGSGLSRGERAKPRALVHLLSRAWQTGQASSLVDSLPVAGVDGTLEHRMRGGAAAGQAWLKTGTLLDARALAGYVRSQRGGVYAVTALVNHPDATRAVPALDGFIEWLARNG
ncbi:MAG TPA: D-alanyl-D-alanine carboxypeptidase/D-alanyl-D-alanine-endopeptidase [Ideonella sp.]|nr:D-alanyl-D-alanine carboxypeptidase/D-alanyl-D-alanine-endopeptidase [Ideonella sp.]